MRLERIAADLAKDPSSSVPDASGDDAALEACYRFLNNDAVTPERILAPHQRATATRAAAHRQVLVLHDTTSFKFCDEDTREGLGPLLAKNGARGFFAHAALVVDATELHDPLGVLCAHTFVRSEQRVYTNHVKTLQDPHNEYRRWLSSVERAHEQLAGQSVPIHVMDREADVYEIFAQLLAGGHRFVIRLSDDRATPEPIEGTKGHVRISQVLDQLETIATREVPLSARSRKRPPTQRRIHPARAGRLARLSVSATPIELLRPSTLRDPVVKTVTLNVVQVRELDPPEGEEPVQWRLLTTERIDTAEQALGVVDMYRARWRIEELFKALKSGCAFEKRQFRSYDALCRMLAVLLPIAWRMLRMRTLARAGGHRPATDVLSTTQIKVLTATSRRIALPQTPTVRDVLLAVAGLGGHLRRNGEPGWQTLGRGLDKLLAYEVGWLAASHADL